jgi:hypothetical protein
LRLAQNTGPALPWIRRPVACRFLSFFFFLQTADRKKLDGMLHFRLSGRQRKKGKCQVLYLELVRACGSMSNMWWMWLYYIYAASARRTTQFVTACSSRLLPPYIYVCIYTYIYTYVYTSIEFLKSSSFLFLVKSLNPCRVSDILCWAARPQTLNNSYSPPCSRVHLRH